MREIEDAKMKKWQALYEVTGPEQTRPNNFQDAFHNDHFKKTLVKFIIYSTGVKRNM